MDLSGVRAVVGADEVLDRLGAEGATDGDTIFLRDDADPQTVAHEIAHWLQEGGGGADSISAPADAAEQEAEQAADLAARGQPVGPLQARRSSALSLKEQGDPTPPDTAVPEGGTTLNKLGIVAWDGSPALRLRSSPTTEEDNVIGQLEFSTVVQMIASFTGSWVYVSTRDGRTGYCSSDYLWTSPEHTLPEPNVKLHRVESGAAGYAINIARDHYGFAADDWGQDLRFYVAVLGAMNHLDLPDSVDGWKTVRFDAGDMIWVPSQPFARGMKGQVNSGSHSYETADALGLAEGIERAGEIIEDFQTAIGLSGQYIPGAVGRHVKDSLFAMLEGLLVLAAGAVVILAVSTAIGAALGALAGGVTAAPGAAAGFEVGLAICEWLGLGFLMVWIAQSIAAIGSAFGAFLGTVWNARGDQGELERAAVELAEAIGVVAGVAVEALVLYAAAKGIPAVLGFVKGTRFGRAIGETGLGKWLGERVGRVHDGESPLPGPKEAMLRTRARSLGKQLGVSEEAMLTLLRRFDEPSLRSLHEKVGSEGLGRLAGKDVAFLDGLKSAWEAAAGDGVARVELAETVRLNDKGTVSNQAALQTFEAYVQFKAEFGDLVSGDFVSRFRRIFSGDAAQADAELRLARDILDGKTALGDATHVEGLAESSVPQVEMPEYRATTPEGTRLVECKAIGQSDVPFTKNTVRGNVGKANSQIRSEATTTGETGGLIRLDASKAARTDVTPELLAEWVSSKLPSPRNSTVTQWVEILYNNAAGEQIKVTLRLEGPAFVVDTVGSW